MTFDYRQAIITEMMEAGIGTDKGRYEPVIEKIIQYSDPNIKGKRLRSEVKNYIVDIQHFNIMHDAPLFNLYNHFMIRRFQQR